MEDGKGNKRDLWVMVDHDGQRTLFQMVDVGTGSDVMRLARELHAPAVVVDVALPALAALDDEAPGRPRQSGNSRLILLNVRTAAGGADVYPRGAQGESLNPEPAPRPGKLPPARIVRVGVNDAI